MPANGFQTSKPTSPGGSRSSWRVTPRDGRLTVGTVFPLGGRQVMSRVGLGWRICARDGDVRSCYSMKHDCKLSSWHGGQPECKALEQTGEFRNAPDWGYRVSFVG